MAGFQNRRLSMPGLKPSDYYLYATEKEFFKKHTGAATFDLRSLAVVGFRLIYAGFHDARVREMILEIVKQVSQDDLDHEDSATRPIYKTLEEITRLT